MTSNEGSTYCGIGHVNIQLPGNFMYVRGEVELRKYAQFMGPCEGCKAHQPEPSLVVEVQVDPEGVWTCKAEPRDFSV